MVGLPFDLTLEHYPFLSNDAPAGAPREAHRGMDVATVARDSHPHAREPVPTLDTSEDLESLARLLEAKDYASFEEAARRLRK
jgi:hypothetical protein